MPSFVEHNGEHLEFASDAEADAYVAQNTPQAPIPGVSQANAAIAQEIAVNPNRPADAGPGLPPMNPAQAGVPGAQALPPSEPTTASVTMKKGDQIWEFPREELNQMLASGFSMATDEDLAAAQEKHDMENPFGESFLGKTAETGLAVAEGAVTGVLSPVAAIESIATGKTVGGGSYLADFYSAMGNGYTREQNERRIRFTAENNELANIIGQGGSFIGGAGVARMGIKAVTAGAKFGTAAAMAGYAVEGAIEGGLAANEAAWIEDRELQADELIWSMGLPSIVGGSLPMASRGWTATKTQMAKAFAKAKKKSGALPGELHGASWGLQKVDELMGGLRGSNDWELERLNVNATRARAKAGFGQMEKAEELVQQDIIDFRALRKPDGTSLHVPGYDDASRLGQARATVIYNRGVDEALTESVAGETFDFLDIEKRFKKAVVKQFGDVHNAESDVIAQFTRDMREHVTQMRGASVPGDALTDVQLSGSDVLALWKNTIRAAASDPAKARGFAEAGDLFEEVLLDGAGRGNTAFAKAIAERKLLRKFAPGANHLLAGDDLASGVANLGDGAFNFAAGMAIKATGTHPIAAGGRILGGARTMRDWLLKRTAGQQLASRYYMGKTLMQEATDMGVENALRKGASTAGRWTARGADVARRTGGFITKDFQRGVIPATAILFNRPGDTPAESYRSRVEELSQSSMNLESSVDSINGRLGEFAVSAHPMLTMELTQRVVGAQAYLINQVPVAMRRGGNPMTPQVKPRPPSNGEIKSFERRWEAVMNPWSVVDNMANNTLSSEAIDAIQNVYPGFYTMLQERTLAALANMTEAPTFKQRRQIEKLVGLSGDLSKADSPEFQQRYAMMKMLAEQQQGAQGPPGPGQGAGGGRPKGSPTLSQQMRSPVDQAMQNIHN